MPIQRETDIQLRALLQNPFARTRVYSTEILPRLKLFLFNPMQGRSVRLELKARVITAVEYWMQSCLNGF